MSDRRSVKSDTRDGEFVMRALAHTAGMTVPEKAAFWLEKLAAAKHRGRHDTWTAARDRAAKDAGIELSMAQRIWQRWQTMNDVGGSAVIKLMLAYEELCEINERAADADRAERLQLKAERNAVDFEPAAAGMGEDCARD